MPGGGVFGHGFATDRPNSVPGRFSLRTAAAAPTVFIATAVLDAIRAASAQQLNF
jgi:hypothetical protein